jgi:hypothetical protein
VHVLSEKGDTLGMKKSWNLELSLKDNQQGGGMNIGQINNNGGSMMRHEDGEYPTVIGSPSGSRATGERYKVVRSTQEVYTNDAHTSLDGAGRSIATSLFGSPIIQAGAVGIAAGYVLEKLVFGLIAAAIVYFVVNKGKPAS